MKIKQAVIQNIIEHAKKDTPVEACGYLAGIEEEIVKEYPMKNIDTSNEHYSLDTKEQFDVVKKARNEGLHILAVYHSHPDTPARPSAEDIKLAYDPNMVYVIVSLAGNKEEIKAFSIKKNTVEEIKLEIQDSDRTDLAELKKAGMIQQKQKKLFAMRLRTVGGDLTTAQLRKIAEVSDRYADGEVHLSTRQGVEIHNVKQENLSNAREYLKEAHIEMGACGPRIRVIVACPGEATCRWGIIDTKDLAKKLDENYFRKDTPHKFKISVTGCPHNCAKATENDIGVMGGILPEWEKESCIHCDLCVNVCPTKAIYKENNEYKLDKAKCILCSICTSTCPTASWIPRKKGYSLFIGGTMGKIPRLGTRFLELIESKDRLMKLIDNGVNIYRKYGRKKERFGHMIDRIGEKKVIREISDGV
ncbi:MAG: Mov34/MPN/PAD-1 family protein [bacterium]